MENKHVHSTTTLRGEIVNPIMGESNYIYFRVNDESLENLNFKTDYLSPENYEDKIFIIHNLETEDDSIFVKEMSIDNFEGEVKKGISFSSHMNYWKGRMGCSTDPEFLQLNLQNASVRVRKFQYGYRVFMRFYGIKPNNLNHFKNSYNAFFDCGENYFTKIDSDYNLGKLLPGHSWAQEDLPNLMLIDNGGNISPNSFHPTPAITYHSNMHP